MTRSHESQEQCQGFCQEDWTAQAIDPATNILLASYDMTVSYSLDHITLELWYERPQSFNGNAILPLTRWGKTVKAKYAEDGTTMWKLPPQMAMLFLAQTAIGTWPDTGDTAPQGGGGEADAPREITPPDGCSFGGGIEWIGFGPASIPVGDSKCTVDCCINHDWGYRMGGPAKCEDDVDDYLFQCIEDCQGGSVWGYVKQALGWLDRRGLEVLFELFSSSGYRVHDEACTCFVNHLPQAGPDEYVGSGFVTKDCPRDADESTCLTKRCEVSWSIYNKTTGAGRTQVEQYDCAAPPYDKCD